MIAGLRATNDAMQRELIEEKKEIQEVDQDKDSDKIRKKQKELIRSDSTGSTTGRKYLAPTLSDPQARNKEKDRYSSGKSKQQRQQPNTKTTLPHVSETNHNHFHPMHGHHTIEQQLTNKLLMQSNANHHVNLVFEVHDWWQEQIICTLGSDDEGY